MKNKLSKTLLFLSVSIILLVSNSCDKDKADSPKTFDLYLDFWNPTGTNPQIKFDATKTSKEVKIDFTKKFEGIAEGTNKTKVIIDNFRIIDDNYRNYKISKITAYEFRTDLNNWKEDVEFTMTYNKTNSLSVVLVLDRSKSLGSDFDKVKSYAVAFVNKIFTEVPTAQMGIVDFSDDVNSLPLGTSQANIIAYINAMQPGEFTAMYNAVDKAIGMFTGVTAESKAILTFTDGTDNNSTPGITAQTLNDKLVKDPSSVKIASFTLGLQGKGGVDTPVLQKLTANGGVSQFPNSVAELDAAFKNFSSAIANVYNLTYTRNQQAILESTPAKLKFSITPQ